MFKGNIDCKLHRLKLRFNLCVSNMWLRIIKTMYTCLPAGRYAVYLILCQVHVIYFPLVGVTVPVSSHQRCHLPSTDQISWSVTIPTKGNQTHLGRDSAEQSSNSQSTNGQMSSLLNGTPPDSHRVANLLICSTDSYRFSN
jgi:hypothetical protein